MRVRALPAATFYPGTSATHLALPSFDRMTKVNKNKNNFCRARRFDEAQNQVVLMPGRETSGYGPPDSGGQVQRRDRETGGEQSWVFTNWAAEAKPSRSWGDGEGSLPY